MSRARLRGLALEEQGGHDSQRCEARRLVERIPKGRHDLDARRGNPKAMDRKPDDGHKDCEADGTTDLPGISPPSSSLTKVPFLPQLGHLSGISSESFWAGSWRDANGERRSGGWPLFTDGDARVPPAPKGRRAWVCDTYLVGEYYHIY